MAVTAKDIAALRAQTGAGMLECKKALDASDGDMEKAIEYLRERGVAKAAKRADKVAAEGTVVSYIHAGGRVGVLVEINSETDFVAKNDRFKEIANDIALHIAASGPRYLTNSDVTPDVLAAAEKSYREELTDEGAENIDATVAEKMATFNEDFVLLEQKFIKDEEKTIEKLLEEATVEIGEKITVRRFARYELGEGIEKKEDDFVAEVTAQAAS